MRVLNLNVWNQNYFWERRLPVISNLLKDAGFNGSGEDILVFHEVTNSNEHDQVSEINTGLHYKNTYFFETKREKSLTSGIGLVTNYMIICPKTFKLTQNSKDKDDSFPRIIGLTELQGKNTSFICGETHFSLSSKTQISNAQESLTFIEKYNERHLPVVVCADFNCGPDEQPSHIFERAGYKDVWRQLSRKELISWPVDKKLVIENHKLKHGKEPDWEIKGRRIDYIWTKGISFKKVLKFGGKVNGIWHSDHWGIIAED